MSNDDKIRGLLEKVEEQKSNLGIRPRASWKTNALFKYKDGGHFNLNTIKDFQVLVDALSFLLEAKTLQEQAADRLGLTSKPFSWCGYPVEEWEDDFKKRIEIVQWQVRKTQLEATKKKLKSLVTEETRTGMELDDIEKLLQI